MLFRKALLMRPCRLHAPHSQSGDSTMHRHLHYIDANLHVSRLGLAFLNQNRTIAVASFVSEDLEYGQLRA